MTNPNSDEVEIVKAMRRIANAEQVIDYAKEPLQEMIHHEGERTFLTASDDLLMLSVFTYINFLGYLYSHFEFPSPVQILLFQLHSG